ncbi:MAG TPA: ImmA/IrrE family metallo-endopeptidase [Verrucomicrobiae bacterium]|jgi:hypothetical protein
MKFTTKNILRETAKQLCLKVRFVDYLLENVYGKLLPRERRILINANKPRYEHVYTLLHEFGHYLLHFKQIKPRRLSPWYLNINWKIEAVADIAAKVRRGVRLAFHSEKGKEWEADLWAMCGFVYLKKFGASTDLAAFLKRHPEKRWIYRLVATTGVYTEIKKPISAGFKLVCKTWRGLLDLLPRLSIPS